MLLQGLLLSILLRLLHAMKQFTQSGTVEPVYHSCALVCLGAIKCVHPTALATAPAATSDSSASVANPVRRKCCFSLSSFQICFACFTLLNRKAGAAACLELACAILWAQAHLDVPDAAFCALPDAQRRLLLRRGAPHSAAPPSRYPMLFRVR